MYFPHLVASKPCCQGSEGPWHTMVLLVGSWVAECVYTSFSLRDFPWCSPVLLSKGEHHTDGCTLLVVARIAQEMLDRVEMV